MGDVIELRGLRVVGTHGVLAEERERAQPFEVDLDVEADLGAAGASDDLSDTVDYGALAALAEAVVRDERHQLLERVAHRIAEDVLAQPGVEAVTVTVRKLRPPVPLDLGSSAVRITRRAAVGAVSTATGPVRAFLGLGSNVGDRHAELRRAVASLPDVVAVSDLYETAPVGGPVQGPYLNCVVELRTERSPQELLEAAHAAEQAAGRRREVRWGPRTLDVDVLWVDGVRLEGPELTVPHPRMFERRFVLAPLAELAPDLVDDDALAASAGEVDRIGPLAPSSTTGGGG